MGHGTLVGIDCGIMGSWDMGHKTCVVRCLVVRCAMYEYFCIFLQSSFSGTFFCHCVVCSSRLDLKYMCTLNLHGWI